MKKFFANTKATRITAFCLLIPFLTFSISYSEIYKNIGLTSGGLAVILILISIVTFAIKRDYGTAFKQFIYLLINGFTFILLTSILITCNTMIDGDHWADNIELPIDVKLDSVLDSYNDDYTIDSIRKSIQTAANFHLMTGGQPGMYKCDIWYKGRENDILFFKVFEITQKLQLSSSSISSSSKFIISKSDDKVTLYENASHFTIYEGDWGDYYGARIELWHRKDGKETLIKEKNYKVQGWMH